MQQIVALQRSASAPAAARTAVSEFDASLGGRGSDARLVASELVTNSLRHSQAPAEEPIEFAIHLDDGSLCIEVCDQSDAHRRGAVRSPDTPTEIGGYGLTIVDTLADAWGVHGDEHTCVWARFDALPN